MGRNSSFWLIFVIILTGCYEEDILTSRDYAFIESIEVNSIDESGASLKFQILDRGLSPIESYGVEYLEKELFRNQFYTGQYLKKEIFSSPEQDNLTVRVETDLVPGVIYFAKPFVKGNGFTVYGEQIEFLAKGSKAPVILETSSKVLGMVLEMTIKGNYFSARPENNIIKIPGTEEYFRFAVMESSTEMIRVKVIKFGSLYKSDESKRFDLKISVLGNQTLLPNYFSIGYPRISAINKLSAKIGEEILVNLILEVESEPMYLTLNYENQKNLLLRLEKIDGALYKTTLTDFSPGKYNLGLLVEGSFTEYPEKFEVLLD
jgi:hypothetical protein